MGDSIMGFLTYDIPPFDDRFVDHHLRDWFSRAPVWIVMVAILVIIVVLVRRFILRFMLKINKHENKALILFGLLNTLVISFVNELFNSILLVNYNGILVADLITFSVLCCVEGFYYRKNQSSEFNPFLAAIMMNYFSLVSVIWLYWFWVMYLFW